MTLTELRWHIVALAQEGNFSRAAESRSRASPPSVSPLHAWKMNLACSCSSAARGFVSPSTVGARVVEQAQVALREAEKVRQVAMRGRDQLDGPLRLGSSIPSGLTCCRSSSTRSRWWRPTCRWPSRT